MAMGRRSKADQQELWIPVEMLGRAAGHPFYERLNQILEQYGFDDFVEDRCAKFYAEKFGRPSLPPGIYFRLLLVGYFEGIDSERGIAWRLADSLSLRDYVGYQLNETPTDHTTLSRTRRLIDFDTHQEVFGWVLKMLTQEGLLKGKTIGIDATTLEANAALRSIVHRQTGESYTDFLKRLAEASGLETPTREQLAKIDRKRKKKGSNADWAHPHDPDARIGKMKDGRTHMAHKVEHAVDMETSAVVAVTVQEANRGDTQSLGQTADQVRANIEDLVDDRECADQLSQELFAELVADKGYHSNDVLLQHSELGIRTYISEPDRGIRRWCGKPEEQAATYANRQRIKGNRGLRLLRSRGELLERPFAHCYETGGMRRTHLRGHSNILKRLLIHVAGFNLALVMRRRYGVGKPRALQGRALALVAAFCAASVAIWCRLRHQIGLWLDSRLLSLDLIQLKAGA